LLQPLKVIPDIKKYSGTKTSVGTKKLQKFSNLLDLGLQLNEGHFKHPHAKTLLDAVSTMECLNPTLAHLINCRLLCLLLAERETEVEIELTLSAEKDKVGIIY
jgi:hypothetical protein